MKFSPQTATIHPQTVTLASDNLPLVSPIHQSVKYTPRNVAHLREILTDRRSGFLYSRVTNPTVRELELLLASLQGRGDAICLSSGIAAIATTVMALVSSGDQVVMFRESYKPTRYLQKHILGKMGVKTAILSLDDRPGLARVFAEGPVKLLIVESPTNPTVRVPDLKFLSDLCKSNATLLILDNTFAGFMHHANFGVDIYVHSLTKHACGHSDAMGGAIIANEELINKILPTAITLGSTLDPHAAWLISRGMKTYSLRTQTSSANAREIATWLSGRQGVKNLRYPGLASHPDHEIWREQMNGDGGSVIAFDIDGNQETADQFIDRLKIFSLTPSMGCVESLVAPCLCLFGDDFSPEEARAAGIQATTIRLAIGIESPKELISDLDQALRFCGFTS